MNSSIVCRLLLAVASALVALAVTGACGSVSNGSDNGTLDGGGFQDAAAPKSPCTNDANCGPEGRCDASSGKCVQCLTLNDCPIGTYCTGGECRSDTRCKSDLECTDEARPVCDLRAGRCVGCLAPFDCPSDHDCINRECVAYKPCFTILDCPRPLVCDTEYGRCAECASDEDCATGAACIYGSCYLRCASDGECASEGLICRAGHCVECGTSEDCRADQFCDEFSFGKCRRDVCAPRGLHCAYTQRFACDADGGGYSMLQPCEYGTVCSESGNIARCVPWACEPDVLQCRGKELIDCSADGLSIESRTDCAAMGLTCHDGACVPEVCTPGTVHCLDNLIFRCEESGGARVRVHACARKELCVETENTATCEPVVCTPNAVLCNATCNSNGTGYVDNQAPCPDGLYCVAGSCGTSPPCGETSCPGEPGSCFETDEGECVYVPDTSLDTAADSSGVCSAVGAGFSRCSGDTICKPETVEFLLSSHCQCAPTAASEPCAVPFPDGSLFVAFHTADDRVRAIFPQSNLCTAPACSNPGLSGIPIPDQAVTLCCHP